MPKDKKLTGRPYGGLAFIVKKNLMCKIKIVLRDPRLFAIIIESGNKNTLIINTYFPVNNRQNDQLISLYFGKLNALLTDHSGSFVIMGDFNISSLHNNFNELTQFCHDNSSTMLDTELLPTSTKTFTSKGNGHFSWIDHIIVSNDLVSNNNTVLVPRETSPSDHIPLFVKIDMSVCTNNESQKVKITTKSKNEHINWKKAPKLAAEIYYRETQCFLENILNTSLCSERHCKKSEHVTAIELLYNNLKSGLQNCENKVNILINNKRSGYKKPGWN